MASLSFALAVAIVGGHPVEAEGKTWRCLLVLSMGVGPYL